jgi:hypothetical protein
VGRLKLRSIDDYHREQVELWGTGFMIGNNIFATSCHVIAPLLKRDEYGNLQRDGNGNLQLGLDANEKLVVNFTATDVPANDKDDYHVNAPVVCSSRDGLDIALLEVYPTNEGGTKLPDALPLFYGTIQDLMKIDIKYWRIGVLIGYGDLLHPIDETTREMYQPYEKYKNYQGSDVKVAMLDGIITKELCDDDNLDIILDTADTTVGESGAIVTDSLDWFDKESPTFVLGVHTCCSAYFGPVKYATPRVEPACARLKRTFHNQDISSWSILNDRTLCRILETHKGQMVDPKGNKTDISCKHLK